MGIRGFLALLIGLALAASLCISLYVGQRFESWAGLPNATDTHSFFSWLLGPLPLDSFVSLVSGLVISIVFFIIVNVLLVRPLRLINRSLTGFAERSERINLPGFEGAPREIRNLAHEVQEFAARVDAAHARDVEMSRVKSDFISTAAHQLRTPLTGIRWALEALEKEPLSESQKTLVESAVSKSHDLVGIVGTLLDITSIESGKYKYDFKRVDLNDVVGAIVSDFVPLAEQTQVAVTFEPTSLPQVSIDKERMTWVLNNLIENAIRYTPAGGNVKVSTQAIANRVVIRVHDTGIGINEKDRNNIFERFYRADNAVAKQNAGSGLGLYIARSIVKDHGGEIDFESNTDGPGTTFTLALPAVT